MKKFEETFFKKFLQGLDLFLTFLPHSFPQVWKRLWKSRRRTWAGLLKRFGKGALGAGREQVERKTGRDVESPGTGRRKGSRREVFSTVPAPSGKPKSGPERKRDRKTGILEGNGKTGSGKAVGFSTGIHREPVGFQQAEGQFGGPERPLLERVGWFLHRSHRADEFHYEHKKKIYYPSLARQAGKKT